MIKTYLSLSSSLSSKPFRWIHSWSTAIRVVFCCCQDRYYVKLQSVEPLHNRGYSIFNQQAGQIKPFGSQHEGFTPNCHILIGKMMISNEDLACQFHVAVKTWVISSLKGVTPPLGLHTPADAMEGLSSRHQRHPRGFAEDHQPGATRRTAVEKGLETGGWGKPWETITYPGKTFLSYDP